MTFALQVGMTRFELATPRPPDAYSNRTELHPEHAISKKALPRGGVFSKSDAKLIHLCEMCKLFGIFFVVNDEFFFLGGRFIDAIATNGWRVCCFSLCSTKKKVAT